MSSLAGKTIMMSGGSCEQLAVRARRPEITADGAYAVLTGVCPAPSGSFLIDDEVLTSVGLTDLSGYRYTDSDVDLQLDLFL